MTVHSWYFGSLESVYFDILCTDSKLQRFKIILKPDLNDATLHVINMSEIISDDIIDFLDSYPVCGGYMICEDVIVYCWQNLFNTWGAYTGLTSAPFSSVVTRWDGSVYSLCPTSGRFVYYCAGDGGGSFLDKVVADLF
jgi:hypothetical protein